MAVPPQSADDPRREIAAPGGVEIGGVVAAEGVGIAHDRVLPGGDAERVQVLLPLQQPLGRLVGGGLGREASHQLHRTLVERAGRLAVGRPLDAAVVGIGRVPRDAGSLERPRVHPGAVAVAVRQVDAPIRHDRVQEFLGGGAAREDVHRPSPAEDPFALGMVARVGLDREQVVLLGRQVVQVALHHVEAAEDRMHVGVLEPRHEHLPGEVDDLGAAARRASGSRRRCPTATIRPASTATARAQERAASTVYTSPPTKIRSAFPWLLTSGSRLLPLADFAEDIRCEPWTPWVALRRATPGPAVRRPSGPASPRAS